MQLLGPKKKWWFIISGIIIIPGIISLMTWGLPLGIDFKGGSLIEFSINKSNVTTEEIKQALNEQNLSDLIIQKTANNQFLIRTTQLDNQQVNNIKTQIDQKVGESKEIRLETVGPTVSKDLASKAIWGVILASIGIVCYIAYAFRRIPKPANSWRFGISAVVALLHDILLVIGVYSILGHFFGYEVDVLFITALLTVIGFSVHDTIVVFDRVRENLKKFPSRDFESTANISIIQTLARSLNTSLTVMIVLLSLSLIGGSSIRHFTITLLVGITTGTYSSIFNATPILVIWQNFINHK